MYECVCVHLYEFTNITEFEMPAHVAASAHFANTDTYTHVHISHILAIYLYIHSYICICATLMRKKEKKKTAAAAGIDAHTLSYIYTNTYICKSTHMSAKHRSWFARTRSFALSWLCGRQTCVFYTLTHIQTEQQQQL